MHASEPKWINPILNIIRVNSYFCSEASKYTIIYLFQFQFGYWKILQKLLIYNLKLLIKWLFISILCFNHQFKISYIVKRGINYMIFTANLKLVFFVIFLPCTAISNWIYKIYKHRIKQSNNLVLLQEFTYIKKNCISDGQEVNNNKIFLIKNQHISVNTNSYYHE